MRGQREQRGPNGSEGERTGAKGSKVYSILGFRVPITSVGTRGEGGRGERRGPKRSKGG